MDYLCYKCSHKEEKQEAPRRIESKQLLLGLSEIGYLTLIAPLPQDTLSSKEVIGYTSQDRLPTEEAFILGMPDELLSKILTLVTVRPSHEWPRNYYGRILPLLLVCSRFNRIASPILYHTAIFENCCGIVPPCLPARKFHRTMHKNPMLRPYVKAVQLYITDLHHIQSIDEYDIANDFMMWFPNVTSFELQAGFANGKRKYTWPMIAKGMKHMPSVREISLYREDFDGLLICDIIENLNIPSLRKLSIDGISGYTHPENDPNREFKTSHFGEKPAKVGNPLF
jgi:F-box-like